MLRRLLITRQSSMLQSYKRPCSTQKLRNDIRKLGSTLGKFYFNFLDIGVIHTCIMYVYIQI